MLIVSVFLFSTVFNQILPCVSKHSTMADVDTQFVRKTNDFALELTKQVFSKENKNVVISPFSISTCLSFAAMGAAGKTAEEMLSVLKYGIPADKDSIAKSYSKVMNDLEGNKSLKMANKAYVMHNYTIKSSFHAIATKSFRSEAETVNFKENSAAAKNINGWVEQKTNNKIKDLVSPDSLDENTRLVLVNAIHFKGTWTHQFDSADTRPEPFWITATESVQVPMMHLKKHFNYGILDDLDATALELTYSDSDVSMLILLPNELDGMSKLENKLLSIDIAAIMAKLARVEVQLALPKFKIEYDLDLKETLEKLGMGTMFSDAADFSELLDQSDPLKVSKVVHKAFIEVNEEGAEAAAATDTDFEFRSQVFQFNADHEFLYILLDHNNQLIVFNGHLRRPS